MRSIRGWEEASRGASAESAALAADDLPPGRKEVELAKLAREDRKASAQRARSERSEMPTLNTKPEGLHPKGAAGLAERAEAPT